MASAATATARLSKDEYKKQKELEEARKAGTAAPLIDEDGNAVNPHIPSYIANAPWYLNNDKPGLKHQRAFQKIDIENSWYDRGKKAGPAASKFRKGACTNCGAMTHQAKFCVERPRKVGAKYTNEDIKEDELVQTVSLDYDGKRDRWNGYDPNSYTKVINAFEKADMERRKQKADSMQFMTEPDEDHARFPNKGKEGEAAAEKSLVESDSDSDSDREDTEFKEGTGYNNAPIQKVDPKTRTTIRNLRIREDTAKYLRNLDLDSAYYDPKTRSMRENPNKTGNPQEQLYAGDNFVRFTGDVRKFGEMQMYAWEAYEKGQDVHLQSAPSQAELLFRDFRHKKENLKSRTKEAIMEKYGGEEHMEVAPKELLLAQTEQYVEYSASGKVIKGQEKAEAKSKYEEDVYINNHTQVWGSYWENGEWGFGCCKQLSKSSYCTGAAGRAIREEILRGAHLGLGNGEEEEEVEEEKALADPEQQKKMKKLREKQAKEKAEKEEKEKEVRFKKALKQEDKRAREEVEKDERKRQFNSRSKEDYNVTEEEMEAYRLKRQRGDDPMKDFVDK